MDWSFRPDRPIYIQIAEGFRTSVATGELQPGDKLKSTKELAAWAGVSPNAMERALGELQSEGLIEDRGPEGRFVAGRGGAEDIRWAMAAQEVDGLVKRLGALGFGKAEIIRLVEEAE